MRPGLRRGLALVGAWAVTRVVLLALLAGGRYSGASVNPRADLFYYQQWAAVLFGASSPAAGPAPGSEYPPGAAALIAPPGVFGTGGAYPATFAAWVLAWDAGLFCVLALPALRSGRRPDGAWLWVLGGAALGPVVLARLDLPVAVAFAAALLLLRRRPAVAGALAAAAATVKLWPLLWLALAALPGMVPAAARRRLLASAAGVLATVAVATAVLAPGRLTSGLQAQGGRGLQLEAVIGVPLLWAHRWGSSAGATALVAATKGYDIVGPGSAALHAATVAILLAGLLALAAATARPRAPGAGDRLLLAGAALPLAVCLAAPVFSPQYLLWPLAAAAVCLDRGLMGRRAALGIVAAAGLTQLLYPWRYRDLVAARPDALLAVTARDALLIAVAVQVVHQIRTRRTPADLATTRT